MLTAANIPTDLFIGVEGIVSLATAIHESNESLSRSMNQDAPPATRHANQTLIEETFQQKYGISWVEGMDREACLNAFARPRADLVAAVDDARRIIETDIVPPATGQRRRTVRGRESGDAIGIDRFLRRDADCWERVEKVRTTSRVVRLAVNLATPSTVEPKQVIWRGAVAIALADELQRKGISVEIIAFRANQDFFYEDRRTAVCACTVKAASEPLDIASLATICCSLGWYRLCFVPAMIAKSTRVVSSHWGRATEISRSMIGADAIIDCGVRNEADAVRQVRRILDEIG